MAYHTIGSLRQEEYSVSNHSSSTAAVWVAGNRGVIKQVLCAVKVNHTASAGGSWTVSKNAVQITGLSSVTVSTCAVGESTGVSTGLPTVLSEATIARGDIISVVGSSLTAANWTFTVQEF